jgi:TPR repeat protein
MRRRIRLLSCLFLGLGVALAQVPIPATQTDLDALVSKAEQGDADSQYLLFAIYSNGISGLLAPDKDSAVKWLRRPAASGKSDAECLLGILNVSRRLPDADFTVGLQLLQKAADANNTRALRTLASLYGNATGVPRDNALAIADMTRAANLGDPAAQDELGEVYRTGSLGVAVNYAIALRWFHASADQGFADALKNIGKCYHLGQGVPVNRAMALTYYAQAADKGSLNAIYNTRLVYKELKEYDKAFEWLERASDRGHLNAMEELAELYEDGLGVAKSPEKAFALCKKAADAGLAGAYFKVAVDYETGSGTDHDPEAAFKYMSVAANAGDDAATTGLGRYYRDGVGVAKNPAQALRWFRKAADRGDSSAKTEIGLMYRDGIGAVPDKKAAAAWFQSACQLDPMGRRLDPSAVGAGDPDPAAFAFLGEMYQEGSGVPRDPVRAVQLFQQGADLGDGNSIGYLAQAYMAGRSVPGDYAHGVQLLRQGAAAGSGQCMYMLGQVDLHDGNYVEALRLMQEADTAGTDGAAGYHAYIFEHGLGVKTDVNMAIYWYNKASQQGDGTAAAKAAALTAISDGNNRAAPPEK